MKKDMQIFKFGLKEIHILQPWVIPVTILDSFFKSIMPFISIFMSSKIIDELLGTKNVDKLVLLVGITIGLNLIVHLLSTGFSHLKTLLVRIMWQNQDMRINEKIATMDYQHLENPETHILRTKISEAEQMNGGGIYALINYFDELIRGLVVVFTSIILMGEIFKSDPNIGGHISFINSRIFNIIFILILAFCTIYNLKLKENSQKRFFNSFNRIIKYSRMFGFYQMQIEDYNTGKSVRLYNQRSLFNKSFDDMYKGFSQILNEIISDNIKYGAANGFISSLLSSLVYVFVGLKAITGSITIGNLVKYTGSINQFMSGSSLILTSIIGLKTNNQYLQLYMDFLNIEGEKYKGTLPVEKRDDDEYQIEFRNVSFKYPGTDNYVLKNISMKLNIGERLAIVGMNGSGKTTFIKLLCRLYDPDEGEILLNGIDIRKYDYDEYLNLFSIVFQDFKLFSFSLGQNVAAAVDYDEDEIEDILVKVGLTERLATMPKGVHTPLYKDFDEDGVEISGGEAQKIALARALYRDAPIIILDEPTAALDPIAEFEIYSKFNEIVGTKTAFYISHRLSSCRFCDEIAVFHEGKIIQKGNHDELIKDEDGKYYELWNSQAQYYKEEAV